MSAMLGDDKRVDFFISYNHKDALWATWVTDVLEDAGYTTVVQARDFRPGDNFVLLMHDALKNARHTLALISPRYLDSAYAEAEWAAAFTRERKGEVRALIPVVVERCDIGGLLSAVIHIDLTGCDEKESRLRLLNGVSSDVNRRPFGTAFPGSIADKLSLAPFPGKLPRVWNVHDYGRRYFAGREDVLSTLNATFLHDSPKTAIQAITGLGGVGKSRLAAEYAFQHASDYDVVWLIRAETPLSISSDLATLAEELGLPDAADVSEALKYARTWLRGNGRWLLIYDNVEDVSAVQEYLPQGPGHVLVTSRLRFWGQAATVCELGVFRRQESISFLSMRIKRDFSQLATLAEVLGDLPLALEQAAAFLTETELSVNEYLSLFDARASEVLREGNVLDYNQTVATTWYLSFVRVQEQSNSAAQMLTLLAFLAPDVVPRSIFRVASVELMSPLRETAIDQLAISKALAVLNKYSLARVDIESVSVHRLVQTFIREIALQPSERETWAQQALDLVRCSFPASQSDIVQGWKTCAALVTHAISVSRHAAAAEIDPLWNSWLLDRVATYLEFVGDRSAALSLQEKALEVAERAFGPNDAIVATRLNNLGGSLFMLDRLVEARRVLERSLKIRTELFGPNHPELASTLANLGPVVYFLGDKQRGREYMKRAIDVADADDDCFTRMVANYANELRDIGYLDDAQELMEHIIQIDRERLGVKHLWVADDLEELAKIADARKLWEDACRYREDALCIKEHVLEDGHPAVLNYRTQIAYSFACIGNTRKAGDLVDGIIGHVRTSRDAEFANTLGLALRCLGRYEEALAFFRICLKRDIEISGDKSPAVALPENNIGITLRDLGRLDEARDHLENAVRLTADQENPIFLANLAIVLADLDDRKRAKELCIRSLKHAETENAKDDIFFIAEKTGKALIKMGEREMGKEYLELCVNIGREISHPEHPVFRSALAALRSVSERYGEKESAAESQPD